MILETDPVVHSICGLTGNIHADYRSEIFCIDQLDRRRRRIVLRLVGRAQQPILFASVVAPDGLTDYGAYRRELCHRIESGGDLTDIVPGRC